MTPQDYLIQKYNVPTPRYTSYPTVPYWSKEAFNQQSWLQQVKISHDRFADQGISLYLHLPFCESLCTYCACNTRITRNHNVENKYADTLLKEWQIYLDALGRRPLLRELHLGGGTPTFFSPKNLERLIQSILTTCDLHPDYSFSFEGHPNNTTFEHLQVLADLGFSRVSFGVQDLNKEVQKLINRIQPFEQLEKVVKEARSLGYAINFDLVYGLPSQTVERIEKTIASILRLRPERIAFYSYAHVPWLRPAQKSYEVHLPKEQMKRALYEAGKKSLLEASYTDLGMDHFALPEDMLYKAAKKGEMHRNFMGYTTSATPLLIGLGASAISDVYLGYMQNAKSVEKYTSSINAGNLSLSQGYKMTKEDMQMRRRILDLTCKSKTSLDGLSANEQNQLVIMMEEGLITTMNGDIVISETGRPFLRNICRIFDRKMINTESTNTVFSQSI